MRFGLEPALRAPDQVARKREALARHERSPDDVAISVNIGIAWSEERLVAQ